MQHDNMPMMAASARNTGTYMGGDLSTQMFQAKGEAYEELLQKAQKQANILKLAIGVPMTVRRVVQVIIADTNENVPLESCLFFKGSEKLTDATDQELFFELDIKDMLEKHNEKRVKLIDKKVKDRTEYLEPAKVRDLKMVVVTVASL